MHRTKTASLCLLLSIISLLFSFAVTGPVLADSGEEGAAQDAGEQYYTPDTVTQDAPQEAPQEQEAVTQDTPQEAPQETAAQDTVTQDTPQEAPQEAVVQDTPKDAREEISVDQPGESKITLPSVEVPEEIYQLKRIDPNKIGAGTSYETFAGVKIPEKILKSPSIGVGERVEIYQEPTPVDAYIIMFKEMQHTYNDFQGYWRPAVFEDVHFRSIVHPLFVRAYGTEITASDPKESSSDIKGQVKYTMDYRDVYREYYPKFPDVKVSRWFQNDVMLISMAKIEPTGWLYTSNVGYRYSTINVKETDPRWDNTTGDEWRSTYYVNQSIAVNPRFEVFAQGEYFKSEHDRCSWSSQPDHYFTAGELRLKSKDMKTSYTGRFSYSIDIYSPSSNTYEKYEIWARVGRDFNDRFNAYTMLKYAYGHTRSEDNAMWLIPPGWVGPGPLPAPFDVTALALTSENRVQYRVYDRLWIQGGFDLGVGINMSDFDNVGWLAGLEYYAPGIIRVDVGWRGNQYYNIDDFLSTVYFKVYFFM